VSASAVDLASRQFTARVIDRRATMSAGEAIDGSGVAFGLLDFVQAIVLHAGFLDRLDPRSHGSS
jgi:hypothetical protein